MNLIKPYINNVIVGDILNILNEVPDNSIDLTITSPPYNKRKNMSGWLVTDGQYTHSNDHMPENQYQDWQIKILNEIFRITKPGGSFFYNHKLRWVDGVLLHPFVWISKSIWTIRQEIIWDRAIAANVRGWRFWQVEERIYWLYKPKDKHLVGEELESKHAKTTSIWRLKPASRSESHPAMFPIELPLRVIYSLLEDSKRKIILDPFCGLGTTLVAAKILGHKYIGIDISPTYVEQAKKRLTEWKKEKEQALEEISKHFINDPFVERKKRGTITWPNGPKNRKKIE